MQSKRFSWGGGGKGEEGRPARATSAVLGLDRIPFTNDNNYLLRQGVGFLFLWAYFFLDWVSYILGWLQTHYVVKKDLEPLILLPLLPERWNRKYKPTCAVTLCWGSNSKLCVCWASILQLSYIPSSEARWFRCCLAVFVCLFLLPQGSNPMLPNADKCSTAELPA